MSDEKLSALETEVAEVISILLELDSESDTMDDQSTIKGCIDRYAQQVERIGDAASEAGFPGLQDACLLLQENLAALNTRNTPITQDERDLLEEWPTLIMGYLTSHEDVNTADEIIRHLQNPCWANPLPEEFSDVLKSLLVTSESSSVISDAQEEIQAAPDSAILTATEEITDFGHASSEIIESTADESEAPDLSPVAYPAVDGLEEGLATLVDISGSFFSEGTDSQQLLGFIEHYDQQLARVGIAAETSGYIGLQELSMLLQENLSYISREADSINEQELYLLEIWPSLVTAYLETPFASDVVNELIEHLQNPAWSRPLPDIYTDTLQSLLKPESEETPVYADSKKDVAIDTNVTYSASESIVEEETLNFVPSWDELLTTPVNEPATLPGEQQPLSQIPPEPATSQESHSFEQSPDIFSEEVTEQLIDEQIPDEKLLEEAEFVDSGNDKANDISEVYEDAFETSHNQIENPGIGVSGSLDFLESSMPATVSDVIDDENDNAAVSQAADDEIVGIDTNYDSEVPSSINQDFIDLLQQEIVEIVDSSEKILQPVLADKDNSLARQQAFASYNEELEKLIEVSQAVGLAGLHQVCNCIQANQIQLAEFDRLLTEEEKELLTIWPGLTFEYLRSPNDEASSESIIAYLQNPTWPMPMGQQEAAGLGRLLNAVEISNELPDDVEERQRHAQFSDVSLTLPEEVNPELLDSLLQELPTQTADFSAVIQKFIEGDGTLADVDRAQRLAHTLKGAANTVGVAGIANLTHHTEDILVALTRYNTLPSPALSEALMNVADCLETMSEALLGMSSPPEDGVVILQAVLDWANRIDKEGIPESEPEASKAPSESSDPVISKESEAELKKIVPEPEQGLISDDKPAAAITDKESEQQTAAVPMLRVPAPLIDDLLRLVGESIILTGQVQERINTNIAQAQAVREQNIVLQQLTTELEQLVDVQGIATTLEHQPSWHGGDFDPLEFDQYK